MVDYVVIQLKKYFFCLAHVFDYFFQYVLGDDTICDDLGWGDLWLGTIFGLRPFDSGPFNVGPLDGWDDLYGTTCSGTS